MFSDLKNPKMILVSRKSTCFLFYVLINLNFLKIFSNFEEMCSFGSEILCVDAWTDGQEEACSNFRNFANKCKKGKCPVKRQRSIQKCEEVIIGAGNAVRGC
jgi:hypothetical protein